MTSQALFETWGADAPAAYAAKLPRDIPAIWPYVTGTPDIRWSEELIAEFPKSHVIRVDQGYQASSPFDADEFDIEAGAWVPSGILGIVQARRERQWSTRCYGTWQTYGAIKAMLADHGVGQSVFWRIADWDIGEHFADLELHADVYAGQWASPTSNPATLFPGTKTTLRAMNADLNVILSVNTGWAG